MGVFSVFDEIHGFGCSQFSLMIRNSILMGIEAFFVCVTMPSLDPEIIYLALETWFLKVSKYIESQNSEIYVGPLI